MLASNVIAGSSHRTGGRKIKGPNAMNGPSSLGHERISMGLRYYNEAMVTRS